MPKKPKPTVDVNSVIEKVKKTPYASIINKYIADREANDEPANIFITQRKQVHKQPAEQALHDCCEEWVNLPQEEKVSRIWHAVILCMRTSQKHSGPNTVIQIRGRYVLENPDLCKDEFNTGKYAGMNLKAGQTVNEVLIWQTLKGQTGFNKTRTTMRNLVAAVDRLAQSGLKMTDPIQQLKAEREAAAEFKKIDRVGPKQSRNIPQYLGLTLYTIPLDLHVQKTILKNKELRSILDKKWKAHFGVSIEDRLKGEEKLKSYDLGRPERYAILEDSIFEFCAKYKLPPAAFDALIMISSL